METTNNDNIWNSIHVMPLDECVEDTRVPYIVYEGEQARNERHIKRLIIALVITIILLFSSNAIWIWYMSGFDIETYDYTQDGVGVNIIGNRNGVDYNVPEISGSEDDTEKESQEENGTS